MENKVTSKQTKEMFFDGDFLFPISKEQAIKKLKIEIEAKKHNVKVAKKKLRRSSRGNIFVMMKLIYPNLEEKYMLISEFGEHFETRKDTFLKLSGKERNILMCSECKHLKKDFDGYLHRLYCGLTGSSTKQDVLGISSSKLNYPHPKCPIYLKRLQEHKNRKNKAS